MSIALHMNECSILEPERSVQHSSLMHQLTKETLGLDYNYEIIVGAIRFRIQIARKR